MRLTEILVRDKEIITTKWLDLIMNTYPPEARDVLRNEGDKFANPIGYITVKTLSGIIDGLVQGYDPGRFSQVLEDIIKIKAVQVGKPSEAVSFIFLLKPVLRERAGLSEELFALESLIDNIAGAVFDIFMECREKIYEIKVSEIRRMTCQGVEDSRDRGIE